MRKPRPAPDPKFVFDPASDAAYVHFDGHQHAPFAAAATSMTRANAWWLAEAALLAYWTPTNAIPRFQAAWPDGETIREAGFPGLRRVE